MTAQFFYGTLRDQHLRAIVAGRDDLSLVPARLADHAVHHAGQANWPMIAKVPGQIADGLLATGLGPDDLARLAFYEGAFGYDLRPVTVVTADGPRAAEVWFPPPHLASPGAVWSLADWQARHGAAARATASEVMRLFGHVAPDRLARLWPMAASRAQAGLRAAQSRDNALSGLGRQDVAVLAERRPYQKFFGLAEYDLTIRQFDGRSGPPMERAVFLSADAALVLPYDPHRDAVLLVEQFRSGPFARGDAFPWCLEPIAGIIDAGETPETTARREAQEEANLALDALIPIGAGYSSPGDSTNHFHMFCAPCDLPETAAGVAGLLSEAENIRAHVLPFARFLDLLDGGHLNVVPLQMMGHWLARHRDALRAAARPA